MTRYLMLLVMVTGALMVGCAKDDGAPGSQEEAVKQAEKGLAECNKCIAANKLDDAAKELKDLEGIKGDLPKDLQKQIEAAAASLKAAQGSKKLSIPKIPGT